MRPSRIRPESSLHERSWPVAVLAAAGLGLSAYLAWTKWIGASALFCEPGSGCDIVQASRYASVLGAPTALWGAFLYAAVLALALAGMTPARWTAAYTLAVVAVVFSAYLTYLALGELHAVCPYCLADAIIAPALLATLLLRGPTGPGHRAAARASRLIAIGVAAAAGTVIVAAGVFVTGAPSASSTAEGALARHLADSGAVFYGVYW